MLAALHILETVLLAVAVVLAWRRSRPATPPFTREITLIAVLIAVQFGLQMAHFRITDEHRTMVGFSWLVQALRVLCLFAAVTLFFRLVRFGKVDRRGIVLFSIGAGAVAFSNGAMAFAGALLLFAVASRLTWPREVHGVTRALVLIVVPVLFVMAQVQTQTTIKPDRASTLLTLGQVRPELLAGTLSIPQLHEMRLAVPLNRFVEMSLAILRAQLFFLFFKLLMLPVGLRGMSLKRRFMVNYFFIRLIPATLSAITILLLVYFGYGLSRLAQVRHDLDATLDRALDLAVHISTETLSTDPPVSGGEENENARLVMVEPDSNAVTAESLLSVVSNPGLDRYREWLGPDGKRALIVVLKYRAGGVTAESSPGAPESLLSDSLFTDATGDTAAGLVEAGGQLFLTARHRARANGKATVMVSLPLDSLYVARIAERSGVDVRLAALPGLFIGPTEVRNASDTTWTPARIGVQARRHPERDQTTFFSKPRYLGRSFLPVGDWKNLEVRGLRGAVQLTVETALRDFKLTGEQTAFLLTTNAWTILFLIIMIIVVAMTESVAVRTGRGIITAILDDVVSLRDAVLRIGRGDLDHRIPVQGKDEIAMLASSVNTMAADLKRQQAEIVEKKLLEADLMVAREIQQRFLPQSAPIMAGMDVAGVSIPSREVGGDLFYFLPLDEGRLGVALGDVSGKSVPAALLMSNVLAALRTEARLRGEVNESLSRINELIVEQVEPGRFVTLYYGIVDSTVGEIRYACAGHNPPLKVSAAGEVTWLDDSGVPLGVVPDARYSSASVPFLPGDVLVLYSDGITEAMNLKVRAAGVSAGAASPVGGPDDTMEFFDEERLVDIVLKLKARSATEIIAGILDAVARFAGPTPQADDMTLVVIRMKSGRAEVV